MSAPSAHSRSEPKHPLTRSRARSLPSFRRSAVHRAPRSFRRRAHRRERSSRAFVPTHPDGTRRVATGPLRLSRLRRVRVRRAGVLRRLRTRLAPTTPPPRRAPMGRIRGTLRRGTVPRGIHAILRRPRRRRRAIISPSRRRLPRRRRPGSPPTPHGRLGDSDGFGGFGFGSTPYITFAAARVGRSRGCVFSARGVRLGSFVCGFSVFLRRRGGRDALRRGDARPADPALRAKDTKRRASSSGMVRAVAWRRRESTRGRRRERFTRRARDFPRIFARRVGVRRDALLAPLPLPTPRTHRARGRGPGQVAGTLRARGDGPTDGDGAQTDATRRARGSLRVSVRRRRDARRRRRRFAPAAASGIRARDHSPARGWRSPRGRRSGGAASGRRRWVRRFVGRTVARFGGGRRRRAVGAARRASGGRFRSRVGLRGRARR